MIDKVIGSYLSLFIDGYFFLFFGLSTKNKKRSNLCELCASAVKCLTAQIEKFQGGFDGPFDLVYKKAIQEEICTCHGRDQLDTANNIVWPGSIEDNIFRSARVCAAFAIPYNAQLQF